MNSQEYNLNIRPGVGIPPIVRVSQNDAGRPLAFKMYDGASALTISSGTTIEIHGTKRSGLGFTEACTWSGSTVSVDTTEAMTQESGAIPTELVFTSGTDVIASANFMLVIEPSPHSAAVTDGTVAEAISAVTRCETYAQAAQDAADEAEAAASTAASDAAAAATTAAETAVNALIGTIPADYSELSADVSNIKADLGDLDETTNGSSSKNYIEGKNLSANSLGYTVIDDDGSCISEDIPITWTWQIDDYVRFYYNDSSDKVYQIWFLNESKTPINYYGRTPSPSILRKVKMPANSAYIRFSFKKGTVGVLDNAQSTPVVYYTAAETVGAGIIQKIGDLDSLETEEKESLVGAINEVEGKVSALENISPEDTTFFHISKNMIDPSTCVLGEIVNQSNGAFSSASAHNRTTYIEINSSTTYVIRSNAGAFGATFRYAFYTPEKAYISGAVGSLPDMLLTSPANAKYIAISSTYVPSNMMIAPYVDENKSFEAFDNVYVKPQFIVAGDADGIVLNLPEKVYALVGYELNIYFDNITENSSLYKWDVTCTKGMQLERGYRITPVAADVGTYTLTIRASISEKIYKEVSTTLVVTAATVGSGDAATVIILGDSTTNNGTVIEKLNANFASDVMSIATLGTRGTSPNLHEGRSGWRLEDYFTTEYIDYTDGRGHVENPFYNPTSQTFDASYYFTNSGVSVPDFFVVNMGINDVFGSANDAALSIAIDQFVDYADSIITSLRTVSQTVKICICCTIPPNYSQDAFGKAYGCNQTRNRCKRNNTMLVSRIISEYDGRESEGIYLIPIHTNLDTVYNMGLETLPVNARNADVTYQSPISNGGVHPVASGYWQTADVYTAFLKANA